MIKEVLFSIATSLNANPVDVCTVISFETAGTFSTSIRGPVTKYGRAVGLIQFMPATAKELGTTVEELSNMSFKEQAKYVVKYLKKRGYKGDGLKSLYSTIFYGKPYKYLRSKATDGYNSFDNIIDVKMKDHIRKCEGIIK